MVIVCLIFLKTAKLFSRVAVQFFHYQQQCMSDPVSSLLPHQHLVLLLFFISIHSDRYQYLIFLFCLIVNDVKYTFICLFAISICSSVT